ncbi:MAG: AzlC family ABC transporter permease [Myxococcota bacterium]
MHPREDPSPRDDACSDAPSARAAAVMGVRRCLTLALGVLPFGIAFGATATELGLGAGHSAAMSVMIFAGAAQMAVLELWRAGASLAVLVMVAVVINLRLGLYGGALARSFPTRPTARRALMAYLITDQLFATSLARFGEPGGQRHRVAFFVGGGLTLWLAWQLGTVLGATLGAQAPPSLGIDFVAPLVFIALAVPGLRDRADVAAAIAAVLTFVALPDLPRGLPLVLAAAVGLIIGTVVDTRTP